MKEDPVRNRYRGEQGRHYHQTKRSIPPAAFDWVARARARKMSPYILAQHTVMEFGVGFGWNLALLSCGRKIGYDPSEFVADGLRQRGIEFVADWRSVPPQSIDVVVCHHTLEHALHPADLLQEMRQVLKPDGTLLLFVPFERERRYRRYNPQEPNHHLYSWNVQTLGNLVEESQLKIQEIGLGRFGQDRFAANWAQRLRLGEEGFRLIRFLAQTLKREWEVRLVARKPSAP